MSFKLNMQKNFLKMFFLSVMVLVPVSCLSVGQEFSSNVMWIEKNKTTAAEIEKKMGAPFRVGSDTGMMTYTYGYYKYSLFGETRTKDLNIRFNPNRTVSSYSFSSSFEEDKKTLQ